MRLAGVGMIGVLHAENVHAALLRFLSRVDFGTLPRVVDTIVIVELGEIAHIYDLEFGLRVPDSIPGDGAMTPVVTVSDAATGLAALEVFRYDGEIVIMPLNLPVQASEQSRLRPEPAERAAAAPADERGGGRQIERELQREIGRFTDGPVEVRMLSDTKAVVYIDDKDVPAAIGKGGKNVAAIVNRIGVGIDIRARSEAAAPAPAGVEEEIGDGAIRIRTDRRHLAIIAPDQSGRIVDVFAGKEYLFTATVNENGEIHLARTSSIAQEMLKRFTAGEVIRMRPV
jgi:ATPase